MPVKPRSFRWRPSLVITDWDETITTADTISLVAEAAYLRKPQFSPKFGHFSKIYLDSYKQYTDDFNKKWGARDSILKEEQFQKGMKSVEMSSINALVESGLFKDLEQADFTQQATKVSLRPHFIDFLVRCHQLAIPVVILSINWTGLIIRECLRKSEIDLKENNITIKTNEFEWKPSENGNLVSTGKWDGSPEVRTALDKKNTVEQLKRQYGSDLLYVGDSSTDLLSMLSVPVGVVMTDGSLTSSLARLGIASVNLKDAVANNENTLYTGDWKDLAAMLE
ncbi:hypothetical protein PICST_34008 [Scheffersomyces stipitis CBS 6054]|uniref:Uncharacterized protein n=1 Tax=Scheffersomyces stipitis (strain ATCC 58785 / CBS 6054 / NBRC 10063 / NRRL Y-11545) TaxID=322104 RepID=A3GEW6_PICST|nr:predicted protein [Scheffersomyces stipitis CBS 6054]EAZ63238.2 hypothetical protein PICST_34008 [Scheffersomyces stipitis CBS 6054]KAG2731535.1 hypothetical protein G9P44_005122 [Scheffersomyces stipitis]